MNLKNIIKIPVMLFLVFSLVLPGLFGLALGDLSQTVTVVNNTAVIIGITSSSNPINYSTTVNLVNYQGTGYATYKEILLTGLDEDTTYGGVTVTIDNSTGSSVIYPINAFTTRDYTPPSPATDLEVEYLWSTPRGSTGSKIIRLNWTATGDNGIVDGSASKYYVVYSQNPITLVNFNSATRITTAPVPAAPGTEEEISLSDSIFSTGIYYFGIIVEDDGDYDASGLALNSTLVTTSIDIDRTAPVQPNLWWDYQTYLTNQSSISVYGYTQENWSEVEIYARPYDYIVSPGYINSSIYTEYNTSLLGTSTLSQNAQTSSSYIYIPLVSGNCPSFASNSNYVKFADHTRDYMQYYSITTAVRDVSYCRIQLSPNPIINSPIGTQINFYDEEYPRGWFNITTQLYPGVNNVSARSIDYYYNSGNVSDTIQIVYDNGQPPTITEDWINNQTYRGEYFIDFNISDESIIDINSLSVKIVNSSNSSNWFLYTYPNDISCSANNAFNNNYTCQMIFNTTPDGWYNFTINITDFFGNVDSTTYVNYFKYLEPPTFTKLKDNGLIQTFNDNGTAFYFNWTMLPPTPIIEKYEYAIGTKPYPQEGWNDVVSLTEFDESLETYTNHGNGNYELWLDFRNCNPVCEPINDKKYYLTIRVFTPLNNSEYYSTDGVIFVDDEEPRTPIISIQDVFNQSYLPVTNYLKFNFTSTDYSGIDKYEIVVSNERYYSHDGTTFVLPENLIYQDIVDAQVTNEITLTNLSLIHGEDYFIHVRSQDNVGLWSNFSIKGFTVDTTPVQGDAIQLPGGITTPYTIRVWKGNDSESGILWEKLIVSNSNYENGACNPIYTDYYTANIVPQVVDITINLVDGKCHNFRLESKNRAGIIKTTYASGASYNQSVPLDLTPPIAPTNVVITSGNEVVTHDRDTVDFRFDKATDEQSGIKSYEYWLQIKNQDNSVTDVLGPIYINNPSGDTISRTINLANLATPINLTHAREYRIMVKAYNKFNSSASLPAYSQYILYSDNTPPTITNVVVRDNSSSVELEPYLTNGIATYELTTNSSNVTITVDELDSTCRYSMTRALYDDMADPTYWWVDGKTISMYINETIKEGVNDVYFLCADQQYNKMDIWSAKHIKLLVDTTEPNITIVNPVINQTYGIQVYFSANIIDTSRIDSVWYRVVNASNPAQIIINDTFIDEELVSDVIEFNHSFENSITNVTLLIFANDTKSNLGNSTVNFTVDGNMPSIVFNSPTYGIDYFNRDFVQNITVTSANFVNVTATKNGIIIYNYTRNSINNQNWNITNYINLTELNISDGMFTILVFAENNISVGQKNNYSLNTTVIIDRNKLNYTYYEQFYNSYNVILQNNDSIYNDNVNDGLHVFIDSNFTKLENVTNYTAPIDTAEIILMYYVGNISENNVTYSATHLTNGTNTEVTFEITKDMILPGRTIYWKLKVTDMANNSVETPMKNFNVFNRELIKTNSLLNDTRNLVVHSNENVTFNLSEYYYDPDYNPALNYYINHFNGTQVYYLQIPGNTVKAIFNTTLGTQLAGIIVSDGFYNITLTTNITFVNYSTVRINNLENIPLNLTIESFEGEYQEIKNIETNSNFSEIYTLQNEINIINKNEPFFQIINLNGTNLYNIDINMTEIDANSTFNWSELHLASIGNLSTDRYYLVNSNRVKFNITPNNFTEIRTGKFESNNYNYKILIYDLNETNVSNYGINSVSTAIIDGITIKYSKYYSSFDKILFFVIDRATTEKCGNSFDDDFDGEIDEGCSSGTTPSSSSSGGSRSSSISYYPVITPEVNETIIDEPITESPDNTETQTTQPEDTKESQKPITPNKNTEPVKPNIETPTSQKIKFDFKAIVSGLLFILALSGISFTLVKRRTGSNTNGLTLKEKVEYLSSKTQQKLNESSKIDDKILKYLEYALAHNFALNDARQKLVEHGFDPKHIDSHISSIQEKYNDINRIRDYLEPRWEDKSNFNKGIKELETVGWSKEYIDTAVNAIINDKS